MFLKAALLAVVLVGVCSERRHGPVLEKQLFYMDVEPKVSDLKEFFDANESSKQDSNLINTIGTGLASFLTPVLVAILSVLIGPLLGGLFGAFGRSSIDTLAAIATTTFPEHSATATSIGLSHAYSTQQKRSTKEEKETIYKAPDFPEHSDYIMSPHQDNYHLNSSSSFTAFYKHFYVPWLITPLNGVSIHPLYYHFQNNRYILLEPLISTVSTNMDINTSISSGHSEEPERGTNHSKSTIHS